MATAQADTGQAQGAAPPADGSREQYAQLVRDVVREQGEKAADTLGVVLASFYHSMEFHTAQVIELKATLAERERHAALVADELEYERSGLAAFKTLARLAGVRMGHKSSDEGPDDHGTMWAAFPAAWSDERVAATLRRIGWSVEGWRCCSGVYDCCGRTFSDGLVIERRGSRVLARLSWGRDV